MKIEETEHFVWEVEAHGDMLVPGRIYADDEIMGHLRKGLAKKWSALQQIVNVASLPGIQKYSLAMSDVHPGYGFPIGGVGAFDTAEGMIMVGGVGFDVNCGVRVMKTPLVRKDIEGKKKEIAQALFDGVPAGLGSTGDLRLSESEIDEVLVEGAKYAVDKGYGIKSDLEYTEANGRVGGALPEAVSHKAKQRQFKQVGTLGSGNHYLEVQCVDEVFDEKAAKAFGLKKDQVLVAIHCGSRALGHQVGTDYLQTLDNAMKKYGLKVLERELVGAPFESEEGQQYFGAVNAAINTAFANRQVIAHLARQQFVKVFGIGEEEFTQLYDIGHNTAKLERHGGKELIVHRKGATRAFGPGDKEVPKDYRAIGQPVLIGGTMGTCSYVLHGTETGMKETFGSSCHGAGRRMSRVQAKKQWWGDTVQEELAAKGILVMGHSKSGLAEEAPGAYKDVDEVVGVMHETDIARKVVKVVPLVNVKG
ncbi:RtcB family protein [archaeon]